MRILVFCLLFILASSASAQNNYWVFLKDKEGVAFDPLAYFDSKAIERRIREGISLHDITDYPLREDYVNRVSALCDSVCGVSRWFNAVACAANDLQIAQIQSLPFVRDIQPMYAAPVLSSYDEPTVAFDSLDVYDNILVAQTERMQYSLLKEAGYTGKGVRIALFDAGFPDVEKNDCFKHITDNKRVVATYDFVRNKENVYRANNHGTHVLSCIGGIKDSIPMGCATDAEFLLARTENAIFEGRIEEYNWIESLEWADKMGADVVNSSLGYTVQFYFRDQMNGSVSLISRAANTALSKGILVVNSAGNEGDNAWEIVGAPADADSVLTIGGIEPWTGIHTGFSSYGPTSDYRRKPNLTAFSFVVTALGRNTGTSFSSPLVAGFAACIRQMHPEWTAKQLFDELENSGDLHPYFDYAHGYGVPQASYFFRQKEVAEQTFELRMDSTLNTIDVIAFKAENDTLTFEERKKTWLKKRNYKEPLDYVFWQLIDNDNRVQYYEVVEPGDEIAATLKNTMCADCRLRVSYKSYYIERPWNQLLEELSH